MEVDKKMNQYDDENTVNDSPDGIDYDSRYDTDEYAQEYFMNTFGSEFEDRLNEIRDKVGRDREEAVSVFADEIMRDYKTPLTTKAEMEEFIWSFI